ncbi:NADPH-dependent FMN reductase [Streptomyces sp. NPDC090445]|uniref:NADPH-dependent FMN reductase n=1 Tax=Streptomyces sp. NPDC090445 TaxID=3365963 RepID=UPI00380C8394
MTCHPSARFHIGDTSTTCCAYAIEEPRHDPPSRHLRLRPPDLLGARSPAGPPGRPAPTAEWQGKPVGLVSYSAGPTGGAPTAEMLRPVLTRVGMLPAQRTLAIPGIHELVDGAGGFRAPDGAAQAPAGILDEVAALRRQPVAA